MGRAFLGCLRCCGGDDAGNFVRGKGVGVSSWTGFRVMVGTGVAEGRVCPAQAAMVMQVAMTATSRMA